MREITMELLNELISDVDIKNTSDFTTFIEVINDYRDPLDEHKVEALIDYLSDSLSIDSDVELHQISDYEKEDLVDFIKHI